MIIPKFDMNVRHYLFSERALFECVGYCSGIRMIKTKDNFHLIIYINRPETYSWNFELHRKKSMGARVSKFARKYARTLMSSTIYRNVNVSTVAVTFGLTCMHIDRNE